MSGNGAPAVLEGQFLSPGEFEATRPARIAATAAECDTPVLFVAGERELCRARELELGSVVSLDTWPPFTWPSAWRGDAIVALDGSEATRALAEVAARGLLAGGARIRQVDLGATLGEVLNRGASVEELRAMLGLPARPKDVEEGPADVYDADLRTFLGDDEPQEDASNDFIIHGLIPRGAPLTIAGAPEAGKTLMMLDIGIAIASGAPDWCGLPISEDVRGGRVLLMPREDPEKKTKRSIWRLCRGRGIHPRDLIGRLVVVARSTLYLDDSACVAKLTRTMRRFDVAFIDSLQTIHRGDENSARDMAAVCGAWRDVALETANSVGLIHHYNGKGADGDRRDPGHRLRGSSVIHATTRLVVGVERLKKPANAISLRVTGNFDHLPAPFAVVLTTEETPSGRVAWRYEPVGELRDLRNPEVADAVLKAIAAAMPKGLGTRDLRAAVRDALDEVDSTHVDREARSLSRAGRIARHSQRSPWRLVEGT